MMGTDIYVVCQRRSDGNWTNITAKSFDDFRSYSIFAFLAGVRNYSAIEPISQQRGLPDDFVMEEYSTLEETYNQSWLSIAELLEFNYDAQMEDRRHTVQTSPNSWNGGATCDKGSGKLMSYREYLNGGYFETLDSMNSAGVERIVFGFDY